MNLRHLVSRKTINNLSRTNGKSPSMYPYIYRNFTTITAPISSRFHFPNSDGSSKPLQNPNCLKPISSFSTHIHSADGTKLSHLGGYPKLNSEEFEEEEEEDGTMNEFLSRFVWIMRGKLYEVYTDCDKETIEAMLLVVVGKVVSEMEKGGLEQMLGAAVAAPSQDFSEDLWRTVWEVSNMVLDDMRKEKMKEKMKGFLQSEEVKEMCRFAGEVGIRGDMLRELRFKWAREKMEESEFYESLERMREEARAQDEGEKSEGKQAETMGDEAVMAEEKPKVVSLPKRRGKIRYKIYGLDLSDPKWAEVADKIHERGELIWPEEPKPISGKCKLVTENILLLNEEEDPSPVLAEWVELLQPSRIDWITLLDRLKEQNKSIYFKVRQFIFLLCILFSI